MVNNEFDTQFPRGQKRKAGDPPVRKRRLFIGADFPYEDGMNVAEVDFTIFALSNDYDVLVHNGHCEFDAHKKVLCAHSSVFKDILESDPFAEEIRVRCSDQALRLMKNIIYSTPRSDWRSGKSGFDLLARDDILDEALVFIEKYELQVFKGCLTKYLQSQQHSFYYNYHEIYQKNFELAKRLRLNGIADLLKANQLTGGFKIKNLHLATSEFLVEFIGRNIETPDDLDLLIGILKKRDAVQTRLM